MTRFRMIVLGAALIGLFTIPFLFSATPAQAKQCSTERPPNARSYWSYRLIDGRKCWYEGKPMLSKTLLYWPTSQTAQTASRSQSNIIPANRYNLLDAQASIPSDPETKAKPEARLETVDASQVPTPKPTLTPNHLRAWADSMAAMTAEPVVTILDRWPDEESPQHRNKPTPNEEPSLMNTRTIMMMTILFMTLLAVVMTAFGARRGGRLQLLDQ
jgi:hypothetical protein